DAVLDGNLARQAIPLRSTIIACGNGEEALCKVQHASVVGTPTQLLCTLDERLDLHINLLNVPLELLSTSLVIHAQKIKFFGQTGAFIIEWRCPTQIDRT